MGVVVVGELNFDLTFGSSQIHTVRFVEERAYQ
jgi:hypothetical protein